ncbi:hypothetical protein [Pseudooceanicola nanhaiensis]|uniref:hypothetical protein n=1 Tax=Pseudooceanicola nanhaiensis TaxID=375761 RepID=UPI001CD292DE|nr:hypothetical protein [Pseudooceanicola nanhaiensis]MCA0922268.1 hypothetical protein [Pseudooceanicola nanhaiensis]
MIDTNAFHTRKARVLKLFHTQLSVQAEELSPALRKAGRRLPRYARKAGAELVAAEGLMGNPKLAVQIDPAGVDKAFGRLTRALETIDPKDRRIGMILEVLGSVAFNLLLFLAICLVVARWRGWL